MIENFSGNSMAQQAERDNERVNLCPDCGVEFQEVDMCEADSNFECDGEDCPHYGDENCEKLEALACPQCGDIRL